jgi:SLT domain-containing protein
MRQHCPIKYTSFSYKRENIPHMAFRHKGGLATAKAWGLKGYMLKVKETCKFTNLYLNWN